MTHPLPERLVGLARAMREHGLEVGTTETIAAAEAIEAVGMHQRALLREALSATLVRSADGRPVFDQLFDLWFPAAPGKRATEFDGADRDTLRDALVAAMAAGDDELMDRIAAAAVEQLGRVSLMDENRGWSASQTVDRMGAAQLIVRAQEMARSSQGNASGGSGGSFTDRVDRDEMRSRVAAFRRKV